MFDFKNASTDRIVGEITCTTTLIKEKIAENIEFRQKHGEKNKELINALIKDNLWYDENTDISKVADELKDELADVIRHSFIA